MHQLVTIIQYVVVRFSSCDAPGLESFIGKRSNCKHVELNRLSSESREWIVQNDQYNNSSTTSITIRDYPHLKRIVIGNDCYERIRLLEMDGLEELERVVIGEYTCTIANDELHHRKQIDGRYRVLNCPKLKSIQIGDCSFFDYTSFEFRNLPSLRSVRMGQKCFACSPSFLLKGSMNWKEITNRSSSTPVSYPWGSQLHLLSVSCIRE